MTTPTAPLTTAAPLEVHTYEAFARLRHVFCNGPTSPDKVRDAAREILTTYAAQVRQDAPHHHDRLLPCPRCKHVALWRVTTNEGEVLLVDSGPLPPGSPSSQTDTGDK